MLLEPVADRGEFGAHGRADALNGGNDRDADTDGNQGIFNRRGTGLIAKEIRYEV